MIFQLIFNFVKSTENFICYWKSYKKLNNFPVCEFKWWNAQNTSAKLLYILVSRNYILSLSKYFFFYNSYQAVRWNTINNERNSISLNQLRIKIMYRIRWHKLLHFQHTLSSFLSAINGVIYERERFASGFYRATASIAYLAGYIECAARA